MRSVTLRALHVYPVKSCRGLTVQAARLTRHGLAHDREWMIVDAQGDFLSQRECPHMARIGVTLQAAGKVLPATADVIWGTVEPDALVLQMADAPAGAAEVPLVLRLDPAPGEQAATSVCVWNDQLRAWDAGQEASIWLSAALGRPARLVRFDATRRRLSAVRWTGAIEAENHFSDGFPMLLTQQSSLDDLNQRLTRAGHAPVPMGRFRPNLVVDGLEAFEEDHLADLQQGPIVLKTAKPCTRCRIITTDQESGQVGENAPLHTLMGYRMHPDLGGPCFGQNLVIERGVGDVLRVGDALSVTYRF